MTLQHLRDAFVMEYKLECQKTGTREILFGDKQIAYMISKAQQDLINRLKISELYTDVSLTAVTTYTEYTLPSNFGAVAKRPKIGDVELDIVNREDIPSSGTLSQGTPEKLAIYFNGTEYKMSVYPLPSSAMTLRLWYFIDTAYFNPASTSAQDWGTFDGSQFSGNVKFPDKYLKAIIDFMVGEVFPQRKGEYEFELSKLKATNATTYQGFKYRFGGY